MIPVETFAVDRVENTLARDLRQFRDSPRALRAWKADGFPPEINFTPYLFL